MAAHRARRQQKALEQWRLVRLTALAVHAPERLPPRPPSPLSPAMTDEAMKQRLLAWRGKDISP